MRIRRVIRLIAPTAPGETFSLYIRTICTAHAVGEVKILGFRDSTRGIPIMMLRRFLAMCCWLVVAAGCCADVNGATLYWTSYHFDPSDPEHVHGELFGLHRADTADIAGTREELIHQLGYQPEYNALAATPGAAYVLEYFNRNQHDYAFEGPANLTPRASAELIGAAIDAAGANTYVAYAEEGVIRRGDFEYENQVDFINAGHVFQPTMVVALDEARGKIYWAGACSGCPLTIGRADLDGGAIEELPLDVPFDDYPVDLAIDSAAGKLYWTNSPEGKIQRSNLDGTDVEDVITGVTAFSLALDPGAVPEPGTLLTAAIALAAAGAAKAAATRNGSGK